MRSAETVESHFRAKQVDFAGSLSASLGGFRPCFVDCLDNGFAVGVVDALAVAQARDDSSHGHSGRVVHSSLRAGLDNHTMAEAGGTNNPVSGGRA